MLVFADEAFTFDPLHTYVLWHINHFGFSNPSGKWFAEGTLNLDEAKPQNSKVNVVIHIDSMVTGIPELDKHLKGPLFFDAAKFPTATFVSSKINVTGKKTAKVQGTLTVHGVSKPVMLDVTLNNIGINPISNKMSVGFSASTTIKRSDFGITTLLPGLSDEVKINIEAEAYK
jgi:polyisoprenoid-binding protein YceI